MEQGAKTNPQRHKDPSLHTLTYAKEIVPTGRKLLFRGPRAGIFQGTRCGNLTYLHSNLFAYKHKTTFVSQKANEQNEESGWALGVKQWAWHMAKASMEKGTHLI